MRDGDNIWQVKIKYTYIYIYINTNITKDR